MRGLGRCGVVLAVWALFASPAFAATLIGRVMSAGGALVSEAFVAAIGRGGDATDVAGADGVFGLSLRPGGYQLSANAPGFVGGVARGVLVRGKTVRDVVLSRGSVAMSALPIFGGATTVAADGTPGVFYAATNNIGGLYRTDDWGGTWTQVDTAPSDQAAGLGHGSQVDTLATSGYPGEVAAWLGGGRLYYSTDYGVSWRQVSGALALGNGLIWWGHAGSRSVLISARPGGRMYVANMAAAHPRFVRMSVPYPSGPIAVADGANEPWLASVDAAGHVSVFPLLARRQAPRPVVTVSGFPAGSTSIGFGGKSGPGAPPSGVYASAGGSIGMSVKPAGALRFPAPAEINTGSCITGVSQIGSTVTPNTVGSYGAAWIDGCWVQDGKGTLTVAGRSAGSSYGTGIAIDAGYNATDSSPGSDAVVLVVGPGVLSGLGIPGPLQAVKLAESDGGVPVPLPPDPTATASPGRNPDSAGVARTGISGSTVEQTLFGLDGPEQIASASNVGGFVSENGGHSFERATYGDATIVSWWKGASGNWLLFGGYPYGRSQDQVTAFLNWNRSTTPVSGGNVPGTGIYDTSLWPARSPGPSIIDAIAGVPGEDAAFLGLLNFGPGNPSAALVRVSIKPGPVFSNLTQLGAGEITNPGPIGYCPQAGSARSIANVLLTIASGQNSSALYRITDADGPSPAATKVLNLPPRGESNGTIPTNPPLKADCGTGTVWAASGDPDAGLLESTNGGRSFRTVAVDDPSGNQLATITAIATTPGHPDSILEGDDNGYIQSSTNAGRSWNLVNDPNTDLSLDGGVTDLAIAPTAGGGRGSPSADLVAGSGEYIGTPSTRAIPKIDYWWLSRTRLIAGRTQAQIVYRQTLPGTTTIEYTRLTPGRIIRGRCITGALTDIRAQRCTIPMPAGRDQRWSPPGLRTLRFNARVAGHLLRPGNYIATLSTRIDPGPTATPRTLRFTVLDPA